jgi:hypothetical protein
LDIEFPSKRHGAAPWTPADSRQSASDSVGSTVQELKN